MTVYPTMANRRAAIRGITLSAERISNRPQYAAYYSLASAPSLSLVGTQYAIAELICFTLIH